MSSATQTLLGLYQIGLSHNINIFDNLTFPEGINHDLVVANILHNAGDYEVLYPDVLFTCDAFKMFSLKWKRTFEKWLNVMKIDYEPLDNYDRKESWSDSHSLSSSESTSASTRTSDSTSNSSISDNDISAFNANTLQNDTSASINAQTAGESKNDHKVQTIHGLKEYSNHGGRVHGNVGVKTTQSIYLEEWELQKLNIYDEIYILFAREFLIPFSY